MSSSSRDGSPGERGADPFAGEHAAFEARGTLESYLRSRLPAEEEVAFEAHLVQCPRCQEELELERSFGRALRAAATEDALRATVLGGLAVHLRRRGLVAALVALAVLAGALGLGRLWQENQRLETRLAELEDLDPSPLLPPSSHPPARDPTAAPDDGPALVRPLAAVPVVLLGVLRGETTAGSITDPGGPWSLALDIGGDPRFESFGVRLADSEGRVLFERDSLLANDLEVIQLTFPSGFLPPGTYELRVLGNLLGGEQEELGVYPFLLEVSAHEGGPRVEVPR